MDLPSNIVYLYTQDFIKDLLALSNIYNISKKDDSELISDLEKENNIGSNTNAENPDDYNLLISKLDNIQKNMIALAHQINKKN